MAAQDHAAVWIRRRWNVLLAGLIALVMPMLLPAAAPQTPLLVFKKTPQSEWEEKLHQVLRNYHVVEADLGRVSQGVQSTGELALAIEDVQYNLQLEVNNIRAPGLRWTLTAAYGVVDEPLPPVATYKGAIEGKFNSHVRFLIRPDMLMGFIREGAHWIYIDPLRRFAPDAPPNLLVAYREEDVRPEFQGVCGTTMLHDLGRHLIPQMGAATFEKSSQFAAVTTHTLQVATDADFEFFQKHGGSTNAFIEGLLNQLGGIYQTYLNLNVSVTFQNVYTTSSQPYTSTDANTLLTQFQTSWNTNRTAVMRDVAHLFTGKSINGTVVGIAFVSAACSSAAYGVTDDFPPLTYKVTAHEIGHNLGAGHDDAPPPPLISCPGNGPIMCAVIQTSGPDIFSSKSQDSISSFVAFSSSSGCLLPGCTFAAAPSAANFSAGGGVGNVSVTTTSVACSWTAESDSAWLVISSGSTGTGNGTVNFTVAPNTRTASRQATLAVAGNSLVVTQGGLPSVGFSTTIAGGGVSSKTSSGQGPLTVSYGQITPNTTAPPVASANFGLTQNGTLVTEVGIPAVTPLMRTRLFIDYSGSSDSGIAVVNPGSDPLVISLVLRDVLGAAVSTGSSTLSLGAYAHLSKFVSQLGLNLPNPFLGTLTLTANGPFAVVNLRSSTNGRGETLFNSLPLVDLNNPPGGNFLVFSQIVDGGGLPTQILLMNPSDAITSAGTIAIFDDNGNPLTLDFGGVIGKQSNISYNMTPAGMVRYRTTGSGPLRAGYAVVTPNSGPLPVGSVIFSTSGPSGLTSQAGVLNSPLTLSARMYVEVATTPLRRNTGIAFVNRRPSATTLTLTLMGADGSSRTLSLFMPANGHIAQFITEFFSGLPISFQGVLAVTSSTPFSPLLLRLTTNQRGEDLASTLPLADLENLPRVPLFIPQVVDGGGYQTQLILLSTSTNPGMVQFDFLNDNGAYVNLPFN